MSAYGESGRSDPAILSGEPSREYKMLKANYES